MRYLPERRRPAAWIAALTAIVALTGIALPAAASAAGAGLRSRQRGAVLSGSIDTTPVGDALLTHVGGEWSEIASVRGERWLLQWDGLVTLSGGILGQTHPYTHMLGVRASGFFEGDYRLRPARPWSLYLGGRLSLHAVVMPPLGTGLGDLATVNDVAGVGGAALGGGLRVVGGASWLAGQRSLLVAAFVGESGRLPQTDLAGAAFTDLGAMARFDVAGSWMLSGEAWWGTTPAAFDAPLARHDRTTHTGFGIDARKIFESGMWVALRVSGDVDSDHVTYAASGATYHTTSAPTMGALLLYGVGIGPQ